MNRKWRLTIIIGLLAILLWYLFIWSSMNNDKSCWRKDKKITNDQKTTKQEMAKAFNSWERDPISSIPEKTTPKAKIPQWYQYLSNKNFTKTDWETGMNGTVMTRKSITPFLLKYAQQNKLEKFEWDDCLFDDVDDESEELQDMITQVCKYRLLRGKNGSYLKDDIMTQTDMLVLLMRSKYWYMNENANPRFKRYYTTATSQWIVKSWLDLDIFEEELTLKDLSLWMQRMHKEKDASVIIAQ